MFMLPAKMLLTSDAQKLATDARHHDLTIYTSGHLINYRYKTAVGRAP